MIREAIVVFVMVLFGEIERDIGNPVVHDPLGIDLGASGDLSAPAEPNAGFLLKRRLDGDFKAAGASLCILVRDRDSVGDYDKLRQLRCSLQH